MNDFIITPIAGAIIGYFTNWLAIKMLFRPHEAKYVFGIRLPFTPGLMPKERFRLSKKIGETVAQHVITGEMIRDSVLSEPNMREIERGLREFLQQAKEPAARIISEKLGEIYGHLAEDSEGVLALLPENTIATAENLLYENIPRFTGMVRTLPPALSDRLIDLTGRVIDEAVGKFVGTFINRERVFEGIRQGLCEYLETEENRVSVSKRFGGWLTEVLKADALQSMPWNQDWTEGMTRRLVDIVFDMAANEFLKSDAVRAGLAQAVGSAFANIDVSKMAEDQINAMDLPQAEALVLSVVNRELQAITVVGGVLGFVIGLVPGLLRLFGI